MFRLSTLLLFVFTLFAGFSFGQLNEQWSIDLNSNLNWQKVTLTGSYLVATDASLAAYEQENGKLLWENKAYAGYSEAEIQELEGSPLLMAQRGTEVSIFSPFDGSEKFNSKTAGLTELSYKSFLYKSNSIFLAGKNTEQKPILIAVDNSNGKIKWKLEDSFGRIISVNEISKDEMIVASLFYIYKFNSTTGAVIWKNGTSPDMQKMNESAMGALFQSMAEQMTKNMDFNIRYYQNLEKDVLVVAAEKKNEKTDANGAVTVTFDNVYTSFRISNGNRVWEQPITLQGKLGDVVFYGNGAILLPDNGNNSKINFHEFEPGGTGLWGKKGNGFNIKGGVYSHVKTGSNFLLVSRLGDNSFLNVLNPETGTMLFEKPVKISGQLYQTTVTNIGIAYVTTEEVNILDPVTGAQLLPKSIQTTPGLTTLQSDLMYMFDKQSGTIKSLNIETAELKDISTVKLKFEGKESPANIEKRDNGILLTSDQNLAMYDMSGSLKFQKYYPAPRESDLKRALLYAQAARAVYIGANAYAASAVLKSATPEAKANDPVGGAIVEGFGMIYEDLGNQASDFAKKSFQQAQVRFKATAAGRDFNIILADLNDMISLVRVSKETGEINATINLGKDKSPKYAVDDVTGRAFVVNGKTKISCYQF